MDSAEFIELTLHRTITEPIYLQPQSREVGPKLANRACPTRAWRKRRKPTGLSFVLMVPIGAEMARWQAITERPTSARFESNVGRTQNAKRKAEMAISAFHLAVQSTENGRS